MLRALWSMHFETSCRYETYLALGQLADGIPGMTFLTVNPLSVQQSVSRTVLSP